MDAYDGQVESLIIVVAEHCRATTDRACPSWPGEPHRTPGAFSCAQAGRGPGHW